MFESFDRVTPDQDSGAGSSPTWFFWASLSAVFLGERPTLREWSGIAMVAAGVLLLANKR